MQSLIQIGVNRLAHLIQTEKRKPVVLTYFLRIFITRDSIYAIARICHRPYVRPSVRPSVIRVDQSKTVELRVMQFSPYSSSIPLVPSSQLGTVTLAD